MQLQITTGIAEFTQVEWNRVTGIDNPFLRYEFLAALESNDCVGEKHGWLPRHLAARNDNGELVGVVPLYLKTNSYGEFVFDWSWADACERQGMAYYPKAVVAIPYTPATGPRLLVRSDQDADVIGTHLIQLAQRLAEQEKLSSLHWLFTDPVDTQRLKQQHFMLRLGCQFHWHNHDYRDFEDFLSTLIARKRKKIKRERRQVVDAGIDISMVHGHEADDALWLTMYDFYRTTFEKKWGYPTLSLNFFRQVAETMGEQIVLIVASKDSEPVAGAICFRSQDTLYGRHWGCYADYHSLHFETCYYRGIDYCIEHGLQHFEPGAQGEHKISRGFLPARTWSAHWIAEPRFEKAIDHFLSQEQQAMEEYIDELERQSPYRQSRGRSVPDNN